VRCTRPPRSRRKRCTCLLRRTGLHPKATIGAAGKRVLTINEFWRLTRIELCDFAQRVTSDLTKFPEGSSEHDNALTSLRNIRYVLARRDFSP